MPGPNTPFRGRLWFVFFAVALLLAHAATLLAGPRHPAVPALSDLIQIACALLAAFACLFAARRLENFGSHFWLLFAGGFFVWTLAGLLSTYYEIVLHASIQQPWPSDIIYFLSMSLPFMSLFIDRDKGFEWKQWPRIFDLVQVIVLMLAAYLFTFETPDAWRNGWGPIGLLAWIPETSRDIILFCAFLVAAFWGRNRRARSLFGSMTIFFAVYLSGETPYLYLQSTRNLRTGTFWDFVWSTPFLVATFIAVYSNPPVAEAEAASEAPVETRDSRHWAFAHAASILFPLIVLLMAAEIAEKQFFSAFTLVVLSFTCSVARIIFAEHQQLQASRALEESNALLKSVFEGTGDGLFIKDREGRCVIANQKFAELCSSTVEQVTGKTTAELMDPAVAHLLMGLDQHVIASGSGKSLQHELTLQDGVHCFITNESPYRDAKGNVVGTIGVIRDVTEYQHMEERLRQSQKMEAIGTLAGGVAHDFNNLLMVISGYSSILFDALCNDHKLRAHADQIFKAGERAASLTRQLLAFSRKQTIQAGKLNLNQVIGGMEKLLQRLIGENILISTRLAPDLGSVFCDAGQFEQVLINLAVNARDAMPDGGRLTFETRNIELGDAVASANNLKPGRYIECVVSDTGIGMDMKVQTRLFEPFFTTKPVGKGTGLGLSTVYGILKQSDGHISFTSQPGCGTAFRIYLPRTDSALPVSVPSFQTPAALNGNETVLLVEDDASVCDFISSVLASHGYRVLTSKRPQDAEAMFDEHGGQVDLLLTDVIMPEISGAELAKRLCARNAQMKVLFMSGYIGDDVVRQGIQETDVPFLQKPFTPLALARRVREILNDSRVRES